MWRRLSQDSVTTSIGTITVGNGGGGTPVKVVFGDLAVGQMEVVVFDVMIDSLVPPGRTHVSTAIQALVLITTTAMSSL